MRRALPILAIVPALLLLLLLLRTDGDRAEPPGPPPGSDACRTTEPAPAPVSHDATPAPAPDSPPAEVEPRREVRVVTNVPGARVTLSFQCHGGAPDPEPITKTTGADGTVTFTFPEIREPLAYVFVHAKAAGHLPHLGVIRSHESELRLRLIPGVSCTGRVLSRDGGPLLRAVVEIASSAGTDANGAFEVFGSKPGPNTVKITHPEHVKLVTEVDLPARDLEFVLERGLSVSGRVTFPDGTPVPGVDLRDDFARRTGRTDRDGFYEISGFEPGAASVFCELGGGRRNARAGATDVNFVLKTHVVRFHVKDEDGRPFRRAHLRFYVPPPGTPFT